MKKIDYNKIKTLAIVLSCLFLLVPNLDGQPENYQNLPQFLYPDFSIGKVRMKEGKDVTLQLNYNLVTEKIVFLQKGDVFDMIPKSQVDTVYIQRRRFVPVGKAFYEVIPGSRLTFFIQHRGTILSPPKPAAYGGTSEVSSSSYMSRVNVGWNVFNMKLENDVRIKYDPLYWITLDNTMYCFTGEKQLIRIFPDYEESIKKFIRSNILKFANREDLLKIFAYCNNIYK